MARTVIYTVTMHLRDGRTLLSDPISSIVPNDDMPHEAIVGSIHRHVMTDYATQKAAGELIDMISCTDIPGYVAVNPDEVAWLNTTVREIRPFHVITPDPTPEPTVAEPSDLVTGVDPGVLVVPAPMEQVG